MIVGFLLLAVGVGGFLFWRYVWFWRNPPRRIPPGQNVVSPADGTVVYVKKVQPHEKVIAIKQGLAVSVNDITRQDLQVTKLLIGVFMSPFDVHYNRMPLTGRITNIRHYPAEGSNHHMGSMHWRALRQRRPIYQGSLHISSNERTVTSFQGTLGDQEVHGYLVQIGGKSVHGIDSYVKPGQLVPKGEIFGMIRIGSQVDLVLTWQPEMQVQVQPGDKVYAGESILIQTNKGPTAFP
ncbi:MAG: phosphatidylserine decarboxylase [Desulfobacca sp.]|uniref:phosphatidylserine decarboxylase n=1 Tax=Desulfobacca sp. TaxID=2067990 RepID=UPI00404A9335